MKYGVIDAQIRDVAFVWSIAGPDIGETLAEIVAAKRRDIQRFGWCLWAYGGGAVHPDTVRRLAHDYCHDQELSALMPDTGRTYPPIGVRFMAYRMSRSSCDIPLPEGMSPETSGLGSRWAFYLRSIEWTPDATVDVARYVAPYAGDGPQPLPRYLRATRGKACAALAREPGAPDVRGVHIVARLGPPYAVFLSGPTSLPERAGTS